MVLWNGGALVLVVETLVVVEVLVVEGLLGVGLVVLNQKTQRKSRTVCRELKQTRTATPASGGKKNIYS